MKIFHASDTHHKPSLISSCRMSMADLIILTGDILDNYGRNPPYMRIIPSVEEKYQKEWLAENAHDWANAIAGRPVVVCPGNHDFIDVVAYYERIGLKNFFSCEKKVIELMGERFVGFREVPYIDDEWVGETPDLLMKKIVDGIFELDPTVLVTHAPPSGILDGVGYGVKALTSALQFRQHRIKAHFFGHTHEHGGKHVRIMDIDFFNGACHGLTHELGV
jgi:Icc-related predicted phosphoesterase